MRNLIKVSPGLRVFITLPEDGDTNDFAVVEGWGTLHKQIPLWIPLVLKALEERSLRKMMVIGPHTSEARKELEEATRTSGISWVWLGRNKIQFTPLGQEKVLSLYAKDLFPTFESALFGERIIQFEKQLATRKLRVLARIREEENLFEGFPVVCQVYEIGSLAQASRHEKNPFGQRAAELGFVVEERNRTSTVLVAACFDETLEKGLLLTEKSKIPFSTRGYQSKGFFTKERLSGGDFWMPGSSLSVFLTGATRALYLFLRSRERWQHPPLDPDNPLFIPLHARLERAKS